MIGKFGEIVAKEAIKFALPRFFNLFGNDSESVIQKCLNNIDKHLMEVANWSSRVQILGMPSPRGVDDSTIELVMSTIPRKYRGVQKDDSLSESDLVLSNESYVILGDPGCGKTTTLKRVCKKMIEGNVPEECAFQYPILVRLRDLIGISVVERICSIIGVPYEVIVREKKCDKKSQVINVQDDLSGKDLGRTSEFKEYKELLVGGKSAEYFVSKFLNETKCLLLIDGLDEVSSEARMDIEKELTSLSLSATQSKIIVTCRSGDFHRTLEGFSAVEICALLQDNIYDIVGRWTSDADEFLKIAKMLPYSELMNRPLFLIQLIIVYKHFGFLPDRPADMYRRIIQLVLIDWSNEQGVKRISKYSSFDPDQKLEFLSAFAYRLTYYRHYKSFTRDDFIKIYEEIYSGFELPRMEARDVAAEIEAHTGLIVESGFDSYEFSHFTIQEYLCAYYIVRMPTLETLRNFIVTYVPPVAVAVSLCSEPHMYLSAIINDNMLFRSFSHDNLVVFIDRIAIERPRFSVSEALGFLVIKLIFTLASEYSKSERMVEVIRRLISIESVKNSMNLSLKKYFYRQERDSIYFFQNDRPIPGSQQKGHVALHNVELLIPQYNKFAVES